MKKFYITAAIPYVNGKPHLGHALEFLQCDAMARFKKLTGYKTCLISGSDENGLKIVQAAEKLNLSPQELADKNTIIFQDLVRNLNVNIDVWRRGSDKKLHWPGTNKLWSLCQKNGDIYKKTYGGFYCVGCEDFYTKKDLLEGKCPEHLTEPEWVEEENYFFRLSRYQDKIEELISSNKLEIIPIKRKNEVMMFLKSGLEDFSISRSKVRSKNWGIPVPGDKNQVIYTWYDALNVYQTAVGFGYDEKLWKTWWPADVHVIGKGILRFHALYWIGMLLSAKLPLPKSIFVHGYITTGGQKMSKSLGNTFDPFEIVNKYGTEATRYYLLREIPAFSDGDFTYDRFEQLYNADLANGLGNLVARVAKLCETSGYKHEISRLPRKLKTAVIKSLEKFDFAKALGFIWRSDVKWGLRWLDQDINESKPWEINDKKLLYLKLKLYVENILDIAYNLQPFMPETAEKILKQFKGPKIKSAPALFPRIK